MPKERIIKDEFFKGMNEYYPDNTNQSSEKSFGSFIDRLSVPEPETGIGHVESGNDFDIKNMDTNKKLLIVSKLFEKKNSYL